MYSMSFTTGGLLYREFDVVSSLYINYKDWKVVEEKVLNDNLFQARSLSSSKRILREVVKRVNCLNDNELSFCIKSSLYDQVCLLWLAICRQYLFIGEFASEVLRNKLCGLQENIEYADFDAFFLEKCEWSEELRKIKISTRNKLRQVLFRMLRESGFISSNNEVMGVILSADFIQLFVENNISELLFFPISNSEYDRIVRAYS